MVAVWLYLALAICSEVAATVSLRQAAHGQTWALAVVVVGYAASFVFLALVLRRLDVGLVYAIWAGAGTALVALIGVVALGEPLNALKVASLVLVVAGVVGLNLSGAH